MSLANVNNSTLLTEPIGSMWINLHTATQSDMKLLLKAAADCEAAGGRAEFLQSSTMVLTGYSPDFKITPITVLTCILRKSK